MLNSFIAYTRVSTARQGQVGVSLQEQQRAISRYAENHGLQITDWYEEQQTAAKKGRPVFDQVMQCLGETPGSRGLLIHKVDRGARNLRDWASIGEAIDLGIDVRFAGDDFDLTTRGGRLAADIQAVIAADYIRNLREEVRKGIEGRLQQGLYPLRAPRGYLDCGGGKVKQPDPVVAPLVISAFQRYATGRYTYKALAEELAIQGLRKADGGPLRPDMIARILKNPFYTGDIRIAGKQYKGIHQPLITPELFRKVQRLLNRRSSPKSARHAFRYSGALSCRNLAFDPVAHAQNEALCIVQYRGHLDYAWAWKVLLMRRKRARICVAFFQIASMKISTIKT
ncbi:recombinase family protein [Gymnodinialimonas sp.]